MADTVFNPAAEKALPDEVKAEIMYRLEKEEGTFFVRCEPSKRLKNPRVFEIKHDGHWHVAYVYKIE